jgi:hypothetical protein
MEIDENAVDREKWIFFDPGLPPQPQTVLLFFQQ